MTDLREHPAFQKVMAAVRDYGHRCADAVGCSDCGMGLPCNHWQIELVEQSLLALCEQLPQPVRGGCLNCICNPMCGCECHAPPTLPAADAAREAVLWAIYDFEEIDAKACGTATIFCEHWRANARTQLDAYAAAITRPLETRVRELERVLRKRTEEIHAEYDDADDIWTCASERCIESCATLTANSEAQDE